MTSLTLVSFFAKNALSLRGGSFENFAGMRRQTLRTGRDSVIWTWLLISQSIRPFSERWALSF